LYLKKVLDRFGMLNSKSVITLISQEFKLGVNKSARTEEDRTYMDKHP
jgi:hypothetical protein